MLHQGGLFALTGKATDAVHMITAGLAIWQSTGTIMWIPLYLSTLTRAYAELGQFAEAWRCIGQALTAVETTKERWYEADVHRTAGEIALMSPAPDEAKAEAFFERALSVARAQQAKSWELRAATSLARLWRDQGKRDPARDLLAPVYGWFTEGFDATSHVSAVEVGTPNGRFPPIRDVRGNRRQVVSDRRVSTQSGPSGEGCNRLAAINVPHTICYSSVTQKAL